MAADRHEMDGRPAGIAPAVALVNPKYPHNVGAAVRAAACFGIGQVWFSGDRVTLTAGKRRRLPREERMKGYQDVELVHSGRFFDAFARDVVPVAVELRDGAELLPQFQHPQRPLYVFGPEDGGLTAAQLRHCHRVVVIPTRGTASTSPPRSTSPCMTGWSSARRSAWSRSGRSVRSWPRRAGSWSPTAWPRRSECAEECERQQHGRLRRYRQKTSA
jgi:tRNA(Leu) C34 or U34 (ribose-2'-O)-methylase TrmL